MIKAVNPIKKSSSCKSQQPKPSVFTETSHSTEAEESSHPGEPSPLMQCNLMDLPGRATLQPKVVGVEQQTTGIAEKSASPVIQRYVRVGLYEGSFGLDHIGVGVNSEKTLGFSPKEGLGREAEKGSWVDGEVKEDHGLLDSLTISTNPGQEARLQAALNRAESSPQKFNLRQHNCSQHGAEILKSAGLNAKSSPVPRAFFEGLKKQYASGQKEADANGQPLQGKFTSNAPTAEPGTRPNRTGMPDRLKSGIESLSGIDMSDVRVHPNSELPARLNALAYTQGNQIYLGPGEERHLPHEAWHVVQQKQGRVRATRQMKGVGVNDDVGMEVEADRMGDGALRGGSLTNIRGDQDDISGSGKQRKSSDLNVGLAPIIQCIKWTWDMNKKIWEPEGGASCSSSKPPDFDGEFDGQIHDDQADTSSCGQDSGEVGKSVKRRYMGRSMYPVWYDASDGNYYNSETNGQMLPTPRTEMHYAEGLGKQAYASAKDNHGALIKATDFDKLEAMKQGKTSEEQSKMDRVMDNLSKMTNLRYQAGPEHGNALNVDKMTGRKQIGKFPRQVDLIQITFPRRTQLSMQTPRELESLPRIPHKGKKPLKGRQFDPGMEEKREWRSKQIKEGPKSDVDLRMRMAADAELPLIAGFLMTASWRIKINGEIKIILERNRLNFDYIIPEIEQIAKAAALEVIGTETLAGHLSDERKYSSERDDLMRFEHLKSGGAKKGDRDNTSDMIITLKPGSGWPLKSKDSVEIDKLKGDIKRLEEMGRNPILKREKRQKANRQLLPLIIELGNRMQDHKP